MQRRRSQQLSLFQSAPFLDRFLPKEKRKQLPEKPGVYFFKSHTGRVLYVGKAKNLKKRISSYLQISHTKGSRKIRRMLFQAQALDFMECRDETEAYLKENHYLRTMKPYYNRLNTNPEYYSYLHLAFSDSKKTLFLTLSSDLESGLRLKAIDPNLQERWFGAFKSRKKLRKRLAFLLTWHAYYCSEMPKRFRWSLPLVNASKDEFKIVFAPEAALIQKKRLFKALQWFFEGKSQLLLQAYQVRLERAAPDCGLTRFQLLKSLAMLSQTYSQTFQKHRQLLRCGGQLEKGLILKEKLDDSLVLFRTKKVNHFLGPEGLDKATRDC